MVLDEEFILEDILKLKDHGEEEAQKHKKMVTKDIDRTYVIPLRREFLKVPKYKRAKKAMTAIKEFLVKHTKVTEFKIGKQINHAVWINGIKNPPHHIKINVKVVEGVAQAELFGHEFSEKKMEKKDKKPETLKEKLVDKISGSKKETKAEEIKETKSEKPVKVAEEVKEPVKEAPKVKEVKTEEPKVKGAVKEEKPVAVEKKPEVKEEKAPVKEEVKPVEKKE